MNSDPVNQPQLRRVILPGGRAIEVIHLASGAPGALAPTEQDNAPHLCSSCACDLVYPLGWQPEGARHWAVELRCPNCERVDERVLDQSDVDMLDEQLDDGTDTLLRDLQTLAR